MTTTKKNIHQTRRLIASALACATCTMLAGPVYAETLVQVEGTTLTVITASGVTNDLFLRPSPDGQAVVIRDRGDTVRAGAGCQQTGTQATCPIARSIRVDAGDGNDRVIVNVDSELGNRISGGPGNDIIAAGTGFDIISGNEGDDVIEDLGGFNLLEGGPGSDSITGGPGQDIIDGDTLNLLGSNVPNPNPGNDFIRGGDGDDSITGNLGTDRINGGPGNDFCDGEQLSNCEQ